MAYTADINIVVKGQAAVNSLQKSLIEVGEKLDELTKKRIGPAATLETFNKQLREARSRLDEVVAGTSNETAAIKNYVTALGNANAAAERQNRLISDEIKAREAATGQLDKLIARQQDFIARTDAAAQAAHRQTAEFIRQQRVAKELAKINANAPAPQLLLAPAAPGSPAMSGGARSLITGPIERLGGARTQDQADMALRFAQALKEQVRPLTQIQALYAGIASEAAVMQRVKALPDAAMLNAASRGIKSLETGQDRYNRELAESAERLQQLDRLEASRARRAEKLRQIADYYGTPSAMANAGFGVQGPAMPPGGIRKPSTGGVKGGLGFNPAATAENLALGAGFPLLFGGGAGQVAGGLAGSFFGQGFGGQILGSAIGQQLEDATRRITEIGTALDQLNMDALRDSVLLVNSELTNQVRLLQEAGRADEARAAIAKEVALQTGLLPEAVTDITNNTNLLGNTWNEFTGAVSGTLAILGAPFVSALTLILQGLSKALQGINVIATGAASILKSTVEWAAKTLGLGGLLEDVQVQTTAISEEEQKRVATLQQLTDGQLKEIQNNQKNLNLESQRTLGRTAAEKEINAEIDKQLANDKIRLEYADKAKQLRQEYANVTTEAGQRELELALASNEALKQQALERQKIKDTLVQQGLAAEELRAKQQEVTKSIQESVDAITRSADIAVAARDQQVSIALAYLDAERQVNGVLLEQANRRLDEAKTQGQRIAAAKDIYNLTVRQAEIEYLAAQANIKAEVQRALLAVQIAEQKFKAVEAAVLLAKAEGTVVEEHYKALEAMRDAIDLAEIQAGTAAEVAVQQERAAKAVFDGQKQAALAAFQTNILTQETQSAANAAGQYAVNMQNAAGAVAQAANNIRTLEDVQAEINTLGRTSTQVATYTDEEMRQQGIGPYANAATRAAHQAKLYQERLSAESEDGTTGTRLSSAMGRYASGQQTDMSPSDSVGFSQSETTDLMGTAGRYSGGSAATRGSTYRRTTITPPKGKDPASINPMINVTTGPVINMDGKTYVSQSDFVAGMENASRRGAQMALEALGASGSTRRGVGLG